LAAAADQKHSKEIRMTKVRLARLPVRQLALWLLLFSLVGLQAFAKDKKLKKDSKDPYATAEFETAPPVNAADLAYRAVVFEDCVIPAEWEAKARKLINETEERAIARLMSTNAFTTVARKSATAPEEPYLLVKWKLLNYRMVSGKARFFGGAIAGTSYITYQVQVDDGKTGTLKYQREVSTENNAFAAAWSFNDKNLPTFLGNVLADYLALRARKDEGVSVLPLENLAENTATETKKKE
jgi:hypothetical protein